MAISTTVYVISGASRGIGFVITSLLAQRENVLIFAGTRDTSKSIPLDELAQKTGGKVVPVKLESANEEDAVNVAKLVEEKAGKVDFLIANAAIGEDVKPVLETPTSSFLKHFTVNTLGPLVLFQQLYPLLAKSSAPRFFVTTSRVGSTTSVPQSPFPVTAYATSKAALNHLVAHIAHEHGEKDGLVVTLLHPGFVATAMARSALEGMGLPQDAVIPGIKMLTPEESAAALVKIVDEAKRETHGGKFLSYDGTDIPW